METKKPTKQAPTLLCPITGFPINNDKTNRSKNRDQPPGYWFCRTDPREHMQHEPKEKPQQAPKPAAAGTAPPQRIRREDRRENRNQYYRDYYQGKKQEKHDAYMAKKEPKPFTQQKAA